MYTLFDSFFTPPTIVVVSEERLKAAELKAKERQLLQVKVQLEQLQEFYDKLDNEVKALSPAKEDAKDA
jgi:predicted NUDIX family phosphoesterase|tara:strand:- start:4217 stop:4423 length:207 start_codon:yes stop_codon:yes gene_type:complete